MPATLIGGIAIAVWSSMALLSSAAEQIPPLELMSLAFAVASLLMLGRVAAGKVALRELFKLPPGAWLSGIGAFLGYHICYFWAVRHAPVIEASLINYLWPLLIVLFSVFLPGSRLGWRPIVGGMLGLLGTYVLLADGKALAFGAHLWGYIAATAAAVIWAAYSVFNRRYRNVPADAVGIYCAATALLGWIAHLLTEPTILPQGTQWGIILALGLGPAGAAYYAWDHGIKHGNLRALGLLSYATPLLSSILLVMAGRTPLTASIFWACLLIVAGGALGSQRNRSKTATGNEQGDLAINEATAQNADRVNDSCP